MAVLNGYKTYIAAVGLGLLALVDLLNGEASAAVEKLVAALGLAGLRSAIAGK